MSDDQITHAEAMIAATVYGGWMASPASEKYEPDPFTIKCKAIVQNYFKQCEEVRKNAKEKR